MVSAPARASLLAICTCVLWPAGGTPPSSLAPRRRGERSCPRLAPRHCLHVRAAAGLRHTPLPLAPRRHGEALLLPRLAPRHSRLARALLLPSQGRRCSSSSGAAAGIPASSYTTGSIPASSSAIVGSCRVAKEMADRRWMYLENRTYE
ncbi:hypothetical protein GQ55_3G315000 [Panicum hallii var. hallii]|uniref:Uncharacterized protein n=1 Tax=Panicum hallii var. hallii TaxID=1504633 RepID=A0A2T7EF98_9POAL|nr:hypothetical protein GQ55_3G315000 [Panicum hallii var. hallii]